MLIIDSQSKLNKFNPKDFFIKLIFQN